MQTLLVGAGDIASAYADALESSFLSVAGVCDLDGDRAARLADRVGGPAFTDFSTALATVDAPLVVNLTSHAAHAEVTRQALRAGRHVYSQKPLALDATEAANLLDTARENDLALGCAPETPRAPSQQRAARLLADGRLGTVRLGYAHAHVGRVTEWHDRPDSFLAVGPLYDGGVYPLTLLTAWFGPVERVRTADTLTIWPDWEAQQPSVPSHVEATLAFASGPTVRLTASLYAPHRSREFYGLELHGDDGSLFVADAGAMADDRDAVQFGRLGREYTTVPPQSPTEAASYVDPLERLAAGIEDGNPSRASGRRGAHVVAICNAIETAADTGGSVRVSTHGVQQKSVTAPAVGPTPASQSASTQTLQLPAIGFGTSRYRDGEYVDRVDAIETALDAGYRLFDTAELYGNEHRIGDLLSAPGAPDRDHLFVLGKVWRTNHRREDLLTAAATSRDELGIEAFDTYALHWPEAWAHQGDLQRLAEKPVERQEALTFPETDDGTVATADIPLAAAWENLEQVAERGWARSLGASNVTQTQLETILDAGTVDPALVQIEHHPYRPQRDLVRFCQEHDISVVAHSPLSAPGLLSEAVLEDIGATHGLTPAETVLAWNVTRGVVPIPSSNTRAHIVSNLAVANERLSDDEMARIDGLRDPSFSR